MAWTARYVGIPFDDRDADGAAHCWGLVRRVYANERGITLPAYGEISASDIVAMARSVQSETVLGGLWAPVAPKQEQEFDVGVMLAWLDIDGVRRRYPVHVGVITAERTILHVERATAAVCVPLSHPSIRFRYSGAFRYTH